MKIKKDDFVQIISGNMKGKKGKVLSVCRKKDSVIIENTGYFQKHIKSQIYKKHPEGGIVKIPKSIHISNVMLISNILKRPVRCGFVRKNNAKFIVAKGKNINYVLIK
jgi:large subunit ribosomal protein L24